MGGIKKLRTLVPTPTHADTACSLAKDLQCLRVLKWRFDNKFPPPISTLVHLRYLSFSQTELKTLPRSIRRLWNLQYLNLQRSYIKKLPESIKKFSSLRYLDLSFTFLSPFPNSIINLSNLRYLSLEGSRQLLEIPLAIGNLKLLDLWI